MFVTVVVVVVVVAVVVVLVSLQFNSARCTVLKMLLWVWFVFHIRLWYITMGILVRQCCLVVILLCYSWIFTFVRWALYKINCGSFCMNRTTFRDPWVGGVLVKTCIIALRRSTFLKEKQIHNVIKFSLLFGLTDLYSRLYNHSAIIKIELDYIRNWNMRR